MQPKLKVRRWLGRVIGVGLASALAVVALVPTAAAAGNPLHTTASSTYTAVPSKGLVNVNVTLKLTNTKADGTETYSCEKPMYDPWIGVYWVPSTCTRTIHYYANSTYLTIEKEAGNLKVTSDAGHVRASLQKGSSKYFKSYKLTFPNLFKGKTRTISASYVIKGGVARSDTSIRVNGAYVDFTGMTAFADTASVKLVVPSSFKSTAFGSNVKTTTKGKQTIYSANSKAGNPSFIGVRGTNPSGFAETVVTSASGREIKVQAWPGDTAWKAAVTTGAADSISTLEGLVGQPIAGNGPILIREVAGGSLGDAYAGEYDKETQMASIPETYADTALVAHELSHAWFNGTLFDAQWMSEGHAEWAERAIGASSTPCVAPSTVGAAEQVDLAHWQYADPNPTDAQVKLVDNQYEAACAIVTDAANRIGADRMKDVFAVLSTSEGAYPGMQDAKPGTPNTWRQWLDAVDERGMVPAGRADTDRITDNLVTYGIATPADLSGRAEARSELAALRGDAGNEWTIPAAVYGPMETWDFTSADRAIGETSATIADVEATAHALPGVTVDANPIRDQMASAATIGELTTVADTAKAQRATAGQLVAAIDRTHSLSPVEAVGTIGIDFDAKTAATVDSVASLHLDAANASIKEIDGTLQGAVMLGAIRILGAALAVLAAIAIVSMVIWRRRRGGPTPMGLASNNDQPRATIEPATGLAAVGLDDQPTMI